MHKLRAAFAAVPLVCLAPNSAAAADLFDMEVDGVVIEEEAPVVVERERIIERRYYLSEGASIDVYERSYRPTDYRDRHYWDAGDEW